MLTVNHAEIDINVISEGFYLKGDVVMQPVTQQNENGISSGDDGGICQVLEKEKEGRKRKRGGSMEQYYSPGVENDDSS